MAFRAQDLATRMMGKKKTKMAGNYIFHSVDGAHDGGEMGNKKRQRLRMALHRQRMRASGMTDDIRGSKEVGGTIDNKYEAEV